MQWLLDKYVTMDSSKTWKTTKKGQGVLSVLLSNTQLVIIHNTVAIDCLTLPVGVEGVRGLSGGAILAIIDERGPGVRRLRLKFESNENGSAAEHCLNCSKLLQNCIPFKNSTGSTTMKHMTMKDNFRALLQKHIIMNGGIPAPPSLPDDFELEEAIRLCILDRGFPDIVQRVADFLLPKPASLSAG